MINSNRKPLWAKLLELFFNVSKLASFVILVVSLCFSFYWTYIGDFALEWYMMTTIALLVSYYLNK